MAIFGQLEHHSLTDLAKVLRHQAGTLFLHSAYAGRSAELQLDQGILRAVYVDGFPVRDGQQLRTTLQTIARTRAGAYEFQPQPKDGVRGPLHARFEDLLIALTSTSTIPEEHLPHEDTRFVETPSTAPIPDDLRPTWQRLYPYLVTGTSARELAQLLQHDVHDLRALLYRLRAAQLIMPQRAAAPPAPPARSSVPSPVLRFLGALRRLTGAVTA